MTQLQNGYTEGVPGIFSVDSTCIDCDMAGISYAARQPKTALELRKAEEALDSCPVGAIQRVGVAQRVVAEAA
jgi:hypothetical protein